MYQVITVIHVLLGLGVIGLVLMQQGKGADAGAAFGTGTSGSVFGAQGAASFLSRTTAILAALFFTTSLGLAVLNGHKGAVYDLMNSSDEKETLINPVSSDPKVADGVPLQPLNPESAVPASVEQSKESPPVNAVEIKDTTVPKSEVIKTVESSSSANKDKKSEKSK
jgi:preprotein translocase subunit SecG